MNSITFKHKNDTYTLMYTAETVKQLENAGFDIDNFGSKLVNNTEMLFRGAFIEKHPNISEDTVKEIWKAMPHKKEVIRTLIQMYNTPVAELFDEPESGEIEWKVSE